MRTITLAVLVIGFAGFASAQPPDKWETPAALKNLKYRSIGPAAGGRVSLGSGEANIRGNVAAGNGIYKSTDAAKTWQHVWKSVGQIGTMVVHPTNADV